MAELSLDVSGMKLFTVKDLERYLEKGYLLGYMACAEEHGHLDSMDSDINIAGISLSEDD